jgi:hypothetical protein
MAGPGANELIDSDPLLGFAEETVEKPAEIAEVAPADDPHLDDRLDEVERTIDSTRNELAQIRSEIATLVGSIEDIKKRSTRRPVADPPLRQSRTSWLHVLSATVGVVLGIAIGVLVWKQLGGAKPVPVGAASHGPEPPAAPPVDTNLTEPAPALAPEPAAPADNPPATPQRDRQSAITPPPIARAEPVAYVGTLSIDAAPSGEVFLNREDAGRTPLRLDKLRAGSHLVWIEREGYQRWTRVVQVRADSITHLSAELEPLGR